MRAETAVFDVAVIKITELKRCPWLCVALIRAVRLAPRTTDATLTSIQQQLDAFQRSAHPSALHTESCPSYPSEMRSQKRQERAGVQRQRLREMHTYVRTRTGDLKIHLRYSQNKANKS